MRRPSALVILLPFLLSIAPAGRIDRSGDAGDEATRPRQEGPSGAREAMTWWHRQRAHPERRIPHGAFERAHTKWSTLPLAASRPLARKGVPAPPAPPDPAAPTWKHIGPAPLDTTVGSLEVPNMSPAAGRASALAVHPTDVNTVYVGYSFGGLWRTKDAGKSWSALMDDQPALAIGAVAIDPASPETIYVGTGESAFYIGYTGQGIFRSPDGGQTWQKLGGSEFDGLSVGRLLLDDGDIYAAAVFGKLGRGEVCTDSEVDASGQGLYRSSDGGASWTLLRAGQIVDVEIDQSLSPRRIFVSDYAGGALRSDDGGKSWVAPAGLPDIQSSPKARRIELTFSPADPSVVWAGMGLGSQTAIYRSTDHGQSFTALSGAPNYCEAQCYYDNSILADPVDPSTVYLGGSLCAIWRTTDALSASPTWSNVSMPGQDCGQGSMFWYLGHVHPDVHLLAVDPKAPERVYAATDGGLAISTDGGDTWTQGNDGVGTLQLYNLCLDPRDPTIVYGGSQDNGIMKRTSESLTWRGLIAGDGGACAVDAVDSQLVLVSGERASVWRSSSAFDKGNPGLVFDAGSGCAASTPGCGDRAAFIAPLVADPALAGVFYVGTNRLWKTDGGGVKSSWKAVSADLTAGKGSVDCTGAKGFPDFDDVLSAIAVAPSASSTLYTGSQAGVVSASTDGGATWATISKAPLPGRWVSGLVVDPADSKVVWVSYSGFDSATPDAPGHVFRSADGGATWEMRDIGVDTPVDSLAGHAVASDLLYAGTDHGTLVTTDGGKSWAKLGTGLPAVAVYSLAHHLKGQKLVAATHGRSAWEISFGPGALTVDPPAISWKLEKGTAKTTSATLTLANADTLGSVVSFNVASGAVWLGLDKLSGQVAGAKSMVIHPQIMLDLEAGAHDTEITFTPAGGAPITVPVHLEITIDGVTPPRVDAEGGCGCRVEGGRGLSGLWALLGLSGALGLRRRRTSGAQPR